MEWVLDNWFLLLFGGGMIAMHLFGHGGHGGHGGHASRKSQATEAEPDGKPDAAPNRDGTSKMRRADASETGTYGRRGSQSAFRPHVAGRVGPHTTR